MLKALFQHVRMMLQELASGYAWIALLPSWQAGVILGALTFLEPMVGGLGFVGALCAWYAGRAAGAAAGERGICVFNGLLCGLFLAHTWSLSLGLFALVLLSSVFAGWLTVVLGRLSWSLVGMPILSLPFSVIAMLALASSRSLSSLQPSHYGAPPALWGGQLDHFLAAIGNFYFLPIPMVGLFIFVVLAFFSRYYVLLAVLGYGAASLWFQLLGAAPEHLATAGWDSNAILAAVLVGGLFAIPSWTGAALAILASVMAAWLSLSAARMLDGLHLLAFSTPFVIAAWLVLYAAIHNVRMSSFFNLSKPDFPERSYERAGVARSRVGRSGSIALALPFMGTWTVSQGFSGRYTHRGAWRHALDFVVVKAGKSFTGQARHLQDFYAYNLPVLSPVYGQVWQVVNDVPDNLPGSVNVAANWGNYVTIKLTDGRFVLLAHLVPGSVTHLPGAWIKPGDIVGRCGNSGRSPQPHIHMHVQIGAEAGAPTTPFHLTNVMASSSHDAAPQYLLATVPVEQTHLTAAAAGEVRPMYLMAGRGLRYTIAKNETLSADWTLHCEVDELGRLVLISNRGARCFAESTWAVFSCYERHGNSDPFFDLWMLACGFSPASFQATTWDDTHVPARQMPSLLARLSVAFGWPWSAFACAHYQRHWDEKRQVWCVQSKHTQRLTGLTVHTEAIISPQVGCTQINATINGVHYCLQAASAFQKADIGVPAWEVPLSAPTAVVRPV